MVWVNIPKVRGKRGKSKANPPSFWSCRRPQPGTVIFQAGASGLTPGISDLLPCSPLQALKQCHGADKQSQRGGQPHRQMQHSPNLEFRESLGIEQGRGEKPFHLQIECSTAALRNRSCWKWARFKREFSRNDIWHYLVCLFVFVLAQGPAP